MPGPNTASLPSSIRTPKPAGHMVLEVRRLAALGVDQRLDRGGPSPAGLKGGPAERDAAQRHQLDLTSIE